MAQLDWDITGSTYPVLNSTLTNPLPQPYAGDYCRQIASNGQTAKMTVSASYASGALVGVPITKMIRAQTCLRSFASDPSTFSWGVKNTAAGANRGDWNGYSIRYTTDFSEGLRLVLNNGSKITITHSIDVTAWFSLRMDVFPIGAAGDRIILYQESSPGSDVWTPLSLGGQPAASGYYVPSNSSAYAPWGGSSQQGFLSGGGGYMLVDKTQFGVSNAP